MHVTTYHPKPEPKPLPGRVGTDTGIKEQLVLSNGIQLQFRVPVTKNILRLHRGLGKRREHGRNWNKIRLKLDETYDECTRQKRDTRNKIVSKLTRTYGTVCYQNDNVAGWQKLWGRRIQATAIGGLTSALQKKAQTPVQVDRFRPSTKTCSQCGTINEIGLNERVYRCRSCGLVIDRNLNAALNNRNEGVPTEYREPTPADTKTTTRLLEYFNSIPGVRASLVDEAGSPQAMRPFIFSKLVSGRFQLCLPSQCAQYGYRGLSNIRFLATSGIVTAIPLLRR
jgi:putative transposase